MSKKEQAPAELKKEEEPCYKFQLRMPGDRSLLHVSFVEMHLPITYFLYLYSTKFLVCKRGQQAPAETNQGATIPTRGGEKERRRMAVSIRNPRAPPQQSSRASLRTRARRVSVPISLFSAGACWSAAPVVQR
jgi:hypothetical protein